MTDAHVSPDYCAHGVGIDRPCADCERWYKGQTMSSGERVFTDEYGFAYRLEAEPTFDADGYPTEETLTRIESWPCKSADDVRACLDFAKRAWNRTYGSVRGVDAPQELAMLHAQKGEKFVRFATGGWSGNESVIYALRQNTTVSALAWCLSSRGGLHIFRY